MKRNSDGEDMVQWKRPRLDEEGSSSRIHYAEGSARQLSEWDDDDIDDELQEVCMIAELSQKAPQPTPLTNGVIDINTENRKLQENLKNKDGEIGILRSQMDQLRKTRQNEALDHRRAVEGMETKYRTDIKEVTKKMEQLRGELEFKEMEIQGLKEKCNQAEKRSPKVNFVPPEKDLFSVPSVPQAPTSKAKPEVKIAKKVDKVKKESDGEKLRRTMIGLVFHELDEPSVLSLSPNTPSELDEFEYTKDDKYKWTDLPENQSHLRRINPYIAELLQSDTFPQTSLDAIHDVVFDTFQNLETMLTFLVTLPRSESFDRQVFENAEPGFMWTVEMLVKPELLKESEHGVEARRAMAALNIICRTNSKAISSFITDRLLTLLANVMDLIGKSIRTLEYSAVPVAVLMFLQTVLTLMKKGEISDNTLAHIRRVIHNIILARFKLDVLREVLKALACGAHHSNFILDLCKPHHPDSISVYMDARLQHALFFRSDACPIKLLQPQVKTLSHMCEIKEHFLATFSAFTNWLQSMVRAKSHLWIFREKECCDVIEGFCYLINICLAKIRIDLDYLRAVELAVIVLRSCTKGKKLKVSTAKKLNFMFRTSGLLGVLDNRSRAAALAIVNSFDKDGEVTQDSTLGIRNLETVAASTTSIVTL